MNNNKDNRLEEDVKAVINKKSRLYSQKSHNSSSIAYSVNEYGRIFVVDNNTAPSGKNVKVCDSYKNAKKIAIKKKKNIKGVIQSWKKGSSVTKIVCSDGEVSCSKDNIILVITHQKHVACYEGSVLLSMARDSKLIVLGFWGAIFY